MQFIVNRSFWQDEAMLAINIINRPFIGLLQPLDYGQVAPVLFLLIEKIFATILTNSEYGFRLFPLFCYGTGAFLFYKIVAQHLSDQYAKIFAAALFAFGFMFILYSGEVKQYMSDVMVMLAMLWIATKNYTNKKNRFLVAGAAGCVAIFLSNIAPVVLLTCGIYALYQELHVERTKRIRPLIGVAVLWISTFLVCYLAFIHNHPNRQFMTAFWHYSFLPTNPLNADFYLFLFKQVPLTVFASLFGMSIFKARTLIVVIPLVVMFVFGIAQLVRSKQFTLLFFICLPLLIHLALSALQLYPFERRLLLYTLPGVAIACAVGFGQFLSVGLLKMRKSKNIITSLALVLIITQLAARYPVRYAEYKSCMMFAQKHGSETRLIYPCFETASALVYYKNIGLIQMDAHESSSDFLTNASSWMLNKSKSKDFVDNVNATLNGQAWLLLAGYDGEIIPPLEKLGVIVLDKFEDKGASIYLVEKKKTTFDE
jgi:hypothetical protein